MSLFLQFTIKTEKSQNDKLNFLRQTSFYKAKYIIFGFEIQNGYSAQYIYFWHIQRSTCKENSACCKENGFLTFSVYVIIFNVYLY